jgi:tetratricopeptide (TPR) repeat protein
MLSPDMVQAHYNLALALMKLNRLKEAEKEFIESIRLKPDLTSAHYNLALIYKQQARNHMAIAELKSALQIDPGYTDAKKALSAMQQSTHSLDKKR